MIGCRIVQRPRRAAVATALALAAALALVLLLTGAVSQAKGRQQSGALHFAQCFLEEASGGCGAAPGVERSWAIAASADGRSVYVAPGPFGGSALVRFDRNPNTGKLFYAACYDDAVTDPEPACEGIEALGEPEQVAVSRDGRSVYTAGEQGNSVLHLDRDGSGSLSFADCVEDATTGDQPSCSQAPGLEGISDIAISRDGRSLYTTAGGGSRFFGVTLLARDPASGSLSFSQCFRNGRGPAACERRKPLVSSSAVAVSGDGRSVYTTASDPQTLTTWSRNRANGRLKPLGCKSGKPGFRPNRNPLCHKVRSLGLLLDVTVSPDGRSVYAADSSAVFRFNREGNGRLSLAQCLTGKNDPRPGCTPTSPQVGSPLAVSGDGRSLYTGAYFGIGRFKRSRSGQISFAQCLQSKGKGDACTRIPGPGGAYGIAVSPDSRSVYISGSGIGHLRRHPWAGGLL